MSSENEGALPGLGEDDSEVLDAPQASAKASSNMRLGVVVMLVVVALGIVFAGVLLFLKHRRDKAAEVQAVAPQVLGDATKQKNSAVQSKSVDDLKADIKKVEAQNEEAEAGSSSDAYKAAALKAAGGHDDGAAPGATQRPGPAGQRAGQGTSGQADAGAGLDRVQTRRERQFSDDLMPAGLAPAKADKSAAGGSLGGSAAPGPSADPFARLQAVLGAQGSPSPVQVPSASMYAARQAGADGDGEAAPVASKGTGLEAQLTPTNLASVKAGRLGNLDFLLKKDTPITCAMRTGVDTTLPSFPVCQVTNDVYSANGKVLLIERGATVHGEQRSKLEQGQSLIFILWNRIDNPSGTYALLDSPASDQMGYGGVAAEIDTHFWARYSGAMMLSLFSDGLAAVVAREQSSGSNGGTTVQLGNTTGTTQNMAAEALKNSINIPPTGRVKPAKVITIIVARDVSFESLFKIVQ